MLFKSLDLTEYESKAIDALIKLREATPKEISFESGVPNNKLYSILSNFEAMGLLAKLPLETKKYKLINLKTFLNSKIREKEDNLRDIKKTNRSIKTVKEQEREFAFNLIKGQMAIMNKLAEENRNAKKEIFGVQRNWKIWGQGLREMQRSVKKKVDIRLIGVINNETKKRALEYKEMGCKIRAYNKKFGEWPLRFTVIDNKKARITLGKPEIRDTKEYITIWTSSKPLITLLRKQFLDMWKESKTF